MSKIHLLSDQTINQIAAGEVIENPASVVKELIENALDAGATRLVIETKGGGQLLIRVIDNGCGMSKEDALLCLQRHATSKICHAEDLLQLYTMGFRGEALASIAAVSKCTLLTAEEGCIGTRIESEAGKVALVEPFARNKGTTVEVRSLFYNTPARKSFQKSAAANGAEITRMVTLLSLSYPHVHFELIQQEKNILVAPECKDSFDEALQQRMRQVLGEEFAKSTFKVQWADGKYQLTGFLSQPIYSRHNRSGQYLFLNKRAVSSPLISYAIQDSYGTRLAAHQYPQFVLHFECPRELVDVNVHPQKKEVRLKEEKWIREKVQEAIRLSFNPVHDAVQPFSFALPAEEPSFSFLPSFNRDIPALVCREQREETVELQLPLPPSSVQVIGLFKTTLLLNGATISGPIASHLQEGIVFVNLIAAYARITFETLLKEKNAQSASQRLLLPLVIPFVLHEATVLEIAIPAIEAFGMGIRLIGKNTFMIDALPVYMKEEDVKPFLEEIVKDATVHTFKPQEKRVRLLALRYAACKKTSFSLEEALLLFDKLLECELPYECPKGKPTMVSLQEAQIFK